ncbi:52 kDa repressor of the inhibitor of the protein kinase-like [Pseudomyrmex gracilis]|uniref:52 kDa repressor of the inhibitor of the protein kinase-like n=1 Tax=Pseudomyrmex gracilis TaxID=219809 RepID=UPI000994D6C4|nr:52 kDa repressor of the inhibitor of the protein kinase-like [Pseudomyrmex gracilis]
MYLYCFIKRCTSTSYKRKKKDNEPVVPFYKFPSNSNVRQQWINAIHKLNHQELAPQLPKYANICLRHFDSASIEQFGFTQIRLKPNSVPSIFPNTSDKESADKESSMKSADKKSSVENITTVHSVQEESNRVVYNSSNDTIIDMEPDCASAGTSKP